MCQATVGMLPWRIHVDGLVSANHCRFDFASLLLAAEGNSFNMKRLNFPVFHCGDGFSMLGAVHFCLGRGWRLLDVHGHSWGVNRGSDNWSSQGSQRKKLGGGGAKDKMDKEIFHYLVITLVLNGPLSHCMRSCEFVLPVIEQEVEGTRDFQVISFRTGLGVEAGGLLIGSATACATSSGSGLLSA